MQAFLDTAPDWLLNAPKWINDFGYQFFKSFIYDERWLQYVEGLGNTLLLTFFALIVGLVLGVIIALVRVSWDMCFSMSSGSANTRSKRLPKFCAKTFSSMLL